MQRDRSVAEPAATLGDQQLVTTGDLARFLERTPRGARWIADQEQLTCERLANHHRIFRLGEVLRLVERRAKARFRRVGALRPRKLNVAGEPQQMSFLDRELRGKLN